MSTTAEAPTFVAPATRRALGDVVPFEIVRPIRLGLMLSYLCAYLWWLRAKGLPIDRISVAISVGIFLVCAFIGKSWRTWGVLFIDCLAYCVMWLAYEKTRSAADDGLTIGIGGWHWFHIGRFELQVESMRNIDRFLFFGHDPNVVLQDHFWQPAVRWWDVVASCAYMTHFVLPILVLAVLWAISHRQFVRFMKRFSTVIGVGCVLFVVLPTAPPWMVSKAPYNLFHELHRNAGRGFYHIGFKGFVKNYTDALGNGNAVAAMPSLHASFALITPAFFLPWIKPKWLKALVLVFPAIMLTSLVYLGEHWVIDGLAGWVIVGFTFWFWNRMEQRLRTVRAERARAALLPVPA